MSRDPFVSVDGTPYVGWWRERFDLAGRVFAGLRFYRRGKSTVWVTSTPIDLDHQLRADAVGLPFLRVGSRLWKPPSVAIVAFGSGARRNAVELDTEDVRVYLAGGELGIAREDPRAVALSPGFVVARYCGVALGCAEWHGDRLLSLIPRGRQIAEVDL